LGESQFRRGDIHRGTRVLFKYTYFVVFRHHFNVVRKVPVFKYTKRAYCTVCSMMQIIQVHATRIINKSKNKNIELLCYVSVQLLRKPLSVQLSASTTVLLFFSFAEPKEDSSVPNGKNLQDRRCRNAQKKFRTRNPRPSDI
jgi:hypothetical protein